MLPLLSSRTCVFMTDERARLLHLLETLTPREIRASDCILRLLQPIEFTTGHRKPDLKLLCHGLSCTLEEKWFGCTLLWTCLVSTIHAASSRTARLLEVAFQGQLCCLISWNNILFSSLEKNSWWDYHQIRLLKETDMQWHRAGRIPWHFLPDGETAATQSYGFSPALSTHPRLGTLSTSHLQLAQAMQSTWSETECWRTAKLFFIFLLSM